MNDKPALLMLHGAVLNGRMWNAVRAELAGDYRIATPDLPGHGERGGRPFRLATAVDVAHASAEALGPGPLVIVGDSLGAYVGLALASERQLPLAGAVLGGCTADFRGLTAAVHRLRARLFAVLSPARLQARLERKIASEFPWSGDMIQRGLRGQAFAEAVAELSGFDVPAALGQLAAPVLLVNGSRDWFHRMGEAWAMQGQPHVECQRLAGIGHGVSIRAPRAFAALLETFAQRHASSHSRSPEEAAA